MDSSGSPVFGAPILSLQSLEPSLWDSILGRRTFLKRTGAATVGTAIALHGFRTEVLASGSTPTAIDKITIYLINNGEQYVVASGTGSGIGPVAARAAAMSHFIEQNVGNLDANHSPNPDIKYTQINESDVLLGVEITLTPAIGTPLNLVETGPDANSQYHCLIEAPIVPYGVGMALTFDYTWGPAPF